MGKQLLRFRGLIPTQVAIYLPVEVLEERVSFGRKQLRVSPTGGVGERWVEETTILTEPEAKKAYAESRG